MYSKYAKLKRGARPIGTILVAYESSFLLQVSADCKLQICADDLGTGCFSGGRISYTGLNLGVAAAPETAAVAAAAAGPAAAA